MAKFNCPACGESLYWDGTNCYPCNRKSQHQTAEHRRDAVLAIIEAKRLEIETDYKAWERFPGHASFEHLQTKLDLVTDLQKDILAAYGL